MLCPFYRARCSLLGARHAWMGALGLFAGITVICFSYGFGDLAVPLAKGLSIATWEEFPITTLHNQGGSKVDRC